MRKSERNYHVVRSKAQPGVREEVVTEVEGQWSGMFAKLLLNLLYGVASRGLAATGVPLDLQTSSSSSSSGNAQEQARAPFMLKAAVSHVLADGDGWVKAYEWRGEVPFPRTSRPAFRT